MTESDQPGNKPGLLRYRRDVPRGNHEALEATVAHVRAHLSAIADHDDDPDTHAGEVWVRIELHEDPAAGLVSVIGELDAAPQAPYLRPGYHPDSDHPHITFHPYEEPNNDHRVDRGSLCAFRAAQ